MRNRFISGLLIAACISSLVSCDKDETPVPVIPPSEGKNLTLDGGTGGASAVNSVFLDLSTDAATSVVRASWDLKFYDGDAFRVKINNTTAATAVAVDKTDINSVSIDDIKKDTLGKTPGSDGVLPVVDNPVTADITSTVIAEVSATEASNKVYVLNPVGATHTEPMDETKLIKIRILRKNGGYTLQYAKLNETTFKTLDVSKNSEYNFQYVSLTTGAAVTVEPAKAEWDIQWTWSMYYIPGATPTPYTFSDLVFINSLAGVQAAEVLTSTVAYDAYGEANIAGTTFASSYDAIGSKWRVTSPTDQAGVKTDRFYVIKDTAGNVYKLKFISFHTNDGGERGKPVIEYKLVKQA